jgi:predicted dehydrogenase
MNLTPQQRATGKENFNAVIGSDQWNRGEETRRDFLMKSIAAGLVSGAGLGAFYYGYEKTLSKPVRVGVIGTGDEGSVLIGGINPNFMEVKAIADIRPYNVHRAFHGDTYSDLLMKVRPGLLKKYGWSSKDEALKHVKVYGDYHDLLANEKDIEAVIIALPLHLHAPCAVAALKAGKHVITEKLMGQTVHECKEMARVAQQMKLLLAVGHQRHYNVLYDNAKDTIGRGLLGELHYIRAQWHRGNLPGHDSWCMPLPPGSKPDDDPNGGLLMKELKAWKKRLDAERLSPEERDLLEKQIAQKMAQIDDKEIISTAKNFGYKDLDVKDAEGKPLYYRPAIEELIRWRLWNRTGAGLMAELGSHQLDAASIFIAAAHDGVKQHPLNVAAAGNRPLFIQGDREVEDHVSCVIEFPAPGYNPDPKDDIGNRRRISVAYSSINGNGFGGYGEIVFGTKGTLILEREQEAMIFKEADTETKIGVKAGAKGPALDTQASGGAQAAAVGQIATQNVSRGYTEELEHFAWCIRNPDPKNIPHCHPKVAMGDAIIALTTNMASRERKRIEFKEEWFDIDRDETPEGDAPDLKRYT